MTEQSPAEKAAERVAVALRKTAEENGHLKEMLNAFGGVLIEQARWKASFDFPVEENGPAIDPARFEKGIPVTGREELMRLGGLWRTAAGRLIPPLAEGFPKIHEMLQRLSAAIGEGKFDPDLFFGAVLGGRDDEARGIAAKIGAEAEVMSFVLMQMARPVVEKRAERIAPAIAELSWNRGYCPVCGSFPSISLLRGKEGQRWLRCCFCATLWRFQRLRCPFCDSHEPGDTEYFYVEGREQERVEVCHGCRKYLPGLDVRNLVDGGVLEVETLGMLHLDVLAREKGYSSATGGEWPGLTGSGAKSDAKTPTS